MHFFNPVISFPDPIRYSRIDTTLQSDLYGVNPSFMTKTEKNRTKTLQLDLVVVYTTVVLQIISPTITILSRKQKKAQQ